MAHAGQNQSVVQGETICFDGSGSTDANGDSLTYAWTVALPTGSTATLDDPAADKPCIAADLAGNYQVSLVVNDGTVDSAPSTAEAVAVSYRDAAIATLQELVQVINALDPAVFNNKNNQNNLTKNINDEVISKIDQGTPTDYAKALSTLQGGSILKKTNGCAAAGAPDNDDWIRDCASQAQVYPLLQEAIGYLEDMI